MKSDDGPCSDGGGRRAHEEPAEQGTNSLLHFVDGSSSCCHTEVVTVHSQFIAHQICLMMPMNIGGPLGSVAWAALTRDAADLRRVVPVFLRAIAAPSSRSSLGVRSTIPSRRWVDSLTAWRRPSQA